jgi:starch phosphorylase
LPSWSADDPTGRCDTERAVAHLAGRLPAALRSLAEIAYDLAWSWQPGASEVFRAVDPDLWGRVSENPVRLLLGASEAALARAARDEALVRRSAALAQRLAEARRRPFRSAGPIGPRRPVAFLCAEFGVHCSLPIYAGGLGALAGDFLKEASDAGLPAVGVGLFYRQDYFHQRVDASGWQHEFWLDRHPHQHALALVTGADGQPLEVDLVLRGRRVGLRVWRACLGRTSLYLLDADLPRNADTERWITTRLYESQREVRLAQYAALGIGGVRALCALGVEPGLVHLNEGHAVFAALELARAGLARGLRLPEALAETRAGLVFTTHTPESAGNEHYPARDLEAALDGSLVELGIDVEELMRLGRTNPLDHSEPLALTALALRASGRANGVSARHGQVAREMWRPLWPERDPHAVPIGHVTNGVHLPTWMAPPMRGLLDRHLGPDWSERAHDPATWEAVDAIPDEELWAVRCALRRRCVDFVRARSVRDRLGRAEPLRYVEAAARCFDPDALTVGFARRIATYKRLHLLVRRGEEAIELLRQRPGLQLVLAGKAHPEDESAKRLLQAVFESKRREVVAERVAFLEDYDLGMAATLVAGADLWLNLPRPPREACGTSGMKSVLNGGLQLSVLDGWWWEAHDPASGWALPGEPMTNPSAQDDRDAGLLLELLQKEILPLFHERDASGVPVAWVRRIKASLRTYGPRVCGRRMLLEYAERLYAPA